jgi:rhodanese-related sulfurtransferase
LTEARYTIVVLEKAKAHIKAVIQREVERVGRVTRLDFILITLLAVCISFLFNFANPQGIPLLPDVMFRAPAVYVDVEEAKRLMDSGEAMFVDARPKEFYDQKHIKGAVNVPLGLFDIIYMMKLSQEDLARPLIVYGRNISKHYDEEVFFRLKQKDHDYVRVLSGGIKDWKAMGYEVE